MFGMSLGTLLMVWGILAPLGAFGWAKADAFFKQRAAVADAVRSTQADERKQCASRIESIAKGLKDEADKRIEEARAAVAALPPTPNDDSGLRSLCERSASCRDRKGK